MLHDEGGFDCARPLELECLLVAHIGAVLRTTTRGDGIASFVSRRARQEIVPELAPERTPRAEVSSTDRGGQTFELSREAPALVRETSQHGAPLRVDELASVDECSFVVET